MPTKSRKEKKESPKKKQQVKKSRNLDKQFYWVIGTMLGLITIFLLTFYALQDSNEFEYQGLTFTKERFGDIPVYHYSRYFTRGVTGSAVQDIAKYNLFLRIDPRENNISVELNDIFLRTNADTFVSVNPENLTQCEYSSVAISTLVSFLVNNQILVKGATPIESLANETNTVHATCNTHPNNEVIIIQYGEETKIYKENKGCYVIAVNNCEILQATEKFIVQSIVDALDRQQS